ncbi:MmgE/PrpD family protein [Arthrobacter sp. M4]|uniref:MmgE/PrpD family protein n=1 Tax=Arthrobacter sp. M4 TaxID=218160 RepID=UPI001CDB67E4|nr:MmgE/PrpD family protein [Arthrobacter sp. M4]MCA4135379.1 MmgE/PrpD family protein [Arthrobacter sp. M4]
MTSPKSHGITPGNDGASSPSVARELSSFAAGTSFLDLPRDVVLESKRILLDAVGCAVAAAASTSNTKARAAVEFGEGFGGSDGSATIFGATQRSSLYGAAFANGELINALDYDAVLPPGHVSPYVLPGALAVAEIDGASGQDLISAIAVAHEMSFRFGKAMDYIRDTKAGVVSWAPVLGYTSTVFGATAAVSRLRGAGSDVMCHALTIAASTTPVNSLRSWVEHTPASTIKYTMAGSIVHTALNASAMAALGHNGDPGVLDDPEFGYPRFIGTKRWEPEALVDGLGDKWHFQRANAFKHYPHCRALHGLLDLLTDSLEENSIASEEITAIRAWGEGHTDRPVWLATEVGDPVEGQLSIAHGLAVGAQRLAPSRAWQDASTISNPEVLRLMKLVTYETHPEWASAIATDPSARPSRLEVEARGEVFVSELRYPRGTPGSSHDLSMTDDELLSKFLVNTADSLGDRVANEVADAIMRLDELPNVSSVLRSLGRVH